MNLITALVGKKNSGKSTIFNKLIKKNDALISDIPNFTRDRQYASCIWKKCNFVFIDTPAIDSEDYCSNYKFNKQCISAIQESHIIFFIIKYTFSISLDKYAKIIHFLQKNKKKFFVIINLNIKTCKNNILKQFYFLGIKKQIFLINCTNTSEVNSLFKLILYPEYQVINSNTQKKIETESIFKNCKNIYVTKENYNKNYFNAPKTIIIGRPNSGKSTLVNSLLNTDRISVSSVAGTTRDNVYVIYKKKNYLFVDTAGISKKNKLKNIQKLILEKVFKTIKQSDIALLVIDPFIGITKQDLNVLKFIFDHHKSIIIAINKYDLFSKKSFSLIKQKVLNKISFFQSVEINFISAKTSYGISNLIKSIDRAYKSKMYTFKTSRLTHILYEAVLRNNLPVVNHTRIKLKYAHVGGYNPLIIIIHGTRASYLPKNYITYLKSYFIRKLNLIGMSLQMKFINK